MDWHIRSLGFVRIRACLKYAYVVKICEDLLYLWKKAKSLEVQVSNRIWIFKDRNIWSGIRQSQYKSNLFGVRIRDHGTKRIHVFTNLLYDSRNLSNYSFDNQLIKKIIIITLCNWERSCTWAPVRFDTPETVKNLGKVRLG